ncbi:MAG: hypothetical protein P8J87_11095 [Verrucomicrobiales bacterium]|nr:hypothetical protein [Verrucomicrobiales bacterium]
MHASKTTDISVAEQPLPITSNGTTTHPPSSSPPQLPQITLSTRPTPSGNTPGQSPRNG